MHVAGDLRLAGQLSVIATRRSDGATIFSGPITGLARFDLGRFGAGQQETLRLRVMLTSTGTHKGDNVLQGGSASVAFTGPQLRPEQADVAAWAACAPSMQAVESIVCPVCGFIAETTDASRLRTVWADHLLGGCGDDVTAITTAMESCIEQRQELWRSGTTDEVPGLTVTIDLLWEALRYARLAEPPVATA